MPLEYRLPSFLLGIFYGNLEGNKADMDTDSHTEGFAGYQICLI